MNSDRGDRGAIPVRKAKLAKTPIMVIGPPVIDPAHLAWGIEEAFKHRVRDASTNFDKFAEFVLRDATGTYVRQAPIHRVWSLHVEACWSSMVYAGVLAPYAHGKTQNLVVGRTSYEIGHDTNIRAKVVCNIDDIAKARVSGVGSVLQSPAYRFVFPNVFQISEDKKSASKRQRGWNAHQLTVSRAGFAIDPTVHARGVLSAGTGGRCDLLVLDDVVDEKNAIQEPKSRDKVASAIDNVWLQRLEPDTGRALYVGTPWHQADYSHRILKDTRWCVLRQWISADQSRIHQEVYNAPDDYPVPPYTRLNGNNGEVYAADRWI